MNVSKTVLIGKSEGVEEEDVRLRREKTHFKIVTEGRFYFRKRGVLIVDKYLIKHKSINLGRIFTFPTTHFPIT